MSKNLRQIKHELLTEWNVVKEDFHCTPNSKLQLVRDGEIWWVGVGENVGVEINAFIFQGNVETAVLAQAKVFSTARLYGRIGQIPDTDLEKVREEFIKLYA